MNNITKQIIFVAAVVFLLSCKKEKTTVQANLKDVTVDVNFSSTIKSLVGIPLTKLTPDNYIIALKSATLAGKNGTTDFQLFSVDKLSQSKKLDFTDTSLRKSLLSGDNIPDGEYSSVKIEIYYLQMRVQIHTANRGNEYRNLRIYLSDDAQNEGGLHQPGDVTQVDEAGTEYGWLFGENQKPDFDPVTPRTNAYTASGDGTSWYDFAGKNAQNYGPFGDVSFMENATKPIFTATVPFTFIESAGSILVIDFNVNSTWQFQDKSNDGIFGPDDLDPVNPTEWALVYPQITVKFE